MGQMEDQGHRRIVEVPTEHKGNDKELWKDLCSASQRYQNRRPGKKMERPRVTQVDLQEFLKRREQLTSAKKEYDEIFRFFKSMLRRERTRLYNKVFDPEIEPGPLGITFHGFKFKVFSIDTKLRRAVVPSWRKEKDSSERE